MSLRPQQSRTESRKKSYKTGVDGDDARRRREDNLVAIRKDKREDILLKKRRKGFPLQELSSVAAADRADLEKKNERALVVVATKKVFNFDEFYPRLLEKVLEKYYSCSRPHIEWDLRLDLVLLEKAKPDTRKQLESIPLMVQAIWSDDPVLQWEATSEFRKLLTIECSLPINEVINAGVIPRFVEFLGRNNEPHLQQEAAWVLTIVASGTSEHTRVVIEHRAIPMFVSLLSSAIEDIREQAVLALGNIAVDSPNFRDLVLCHGALVPLLGQLNEHSSLSMLRDATWTLPKFCRGQPPPRFEQVKPALSVLYRLLHSRDEQVLRDACWALSYLSNGSNEKIQAVIEAGVCHRLVQLLLHPSPAVILPALRTVGNIVSGDDSQTQFIIDIQMLPCLFQLLTQPHKKDIKKEACTAVSNIIAGTQAQIQAVIDANIIPPLIHLLQTAEFDIKKEAAWSISNAICRGSHQQIRFLARQDCTKPLCGLLTCPDPRIVTVCLDAFANILKVGEADKKSGLRNKGTNPYIGTVDECEGIDKIGSLQNHDNHDIHGKAVTLLDTYWTEADDAEETIQNDGVPNGGFKFG